MSLCYNCTELRNKPWVINIFGWGGDLKKTKTKGKSHQSNKRICLSEQIKCMKQNEKKKPHRHSVLSSVFNKTLQPNVCERQHSPQYKQRRNSHIRRTPWEQAPQRAPTGHRSVHGQMPDLHVLWGSRVCMYGWRLLMYMVLTKELFFYSLQ